LTNLGLIAIDFGVDHAIGAKLFPTMIDVAIVKREFLAFKLQASKEWQRQKIL